MLRRTLSAFAILALLGFSVLSVSVGAGDGHAGVHDWSCSAGRAIRGKVLLTLDRRGYPVNFWHRLSRL